MDVTLSIWKSRVYVILPVAKNRAGEKYVTSILRVSRRRQLFSKYFKKSENCSSDLLGKHDEEKANVCSSCSTFVGAAAELVSISSFTVKKNVLDFWH